MEFSRQEYWSRLLCPPPGGLPDQGLNPSVLFFLHWQAGSLPTVPPGKPFLLHFVIVQSLSCVQLFVTWWTAAHQASLSSTVSWSLLKLMSMELVMLSSLTTSSFVARFSSCFQSFLSSSSFPVSRLFASGGQVLELQFSICPSNEYSWLISLGLTVWISLQSKGLSRVFSSTAVRKHQFFGAQPSLWSNSHIHTWLLEKP